MFFLSMVIYFLVIQTRSLTQTKKRKSSIDFTIVLNLNSTRDLVSTSDTNPQPAWTRSVWYRGLKYRNFVCYRNVATIHKKNYNCSMYNWSIWLCHYSCDDSICMRSLLASWTHSPNSKFSNKLTRFISKQVQFYVIVLCDLYSTQV